MQRATEMAITVRYGYATSIGSFVWALTKWESDREGHLTGPWGVDGRHLTRLNDLLQCGVMVGSRVGRRIIAIDLHFY